MTGRVDDWDEYLRDGWAAVELARDDLSQLWSDADIIHRQPAARERVERAVARYRERLTAYNAYRERKMTPLLGDQAGLSQARPTLARIADLAVRACAEIDLTPPPWLVALSVRLHGR